MSLSSLEHVIIDILNYFDKSFHLFQFSIRQHKYSMFVCRNGLINFGNMDAVILVFLFIFRVSLTLACPMNLKLFPLDTQVIIIRLGPVGRIPDILLISNTGYPVSDRITGYLSRKIYFMKWFFII